MTSNREGSDHNTSSSQFAARSRSCCQLWASASPNVPTPGMRMRTLCQHAQEKARSLHCAHPLPLAAQSAHDELQDTGSTEVTTASSNACEPPNRGANRATCKARTLAHKARPGKATTANMDTDRNKGGLAVACASPPQAASTPEEGQWD